MKEVKIEDAYRKWLDDLKESPPEEVWPAINDALDVTDVWQKVYVKLPDAPLSRPSLLDQLVWRLRAVTRLAAAAILLITMTTPVPEFQGQMPTAEKIDHTATGTGNKQSMAAVPPANTNSGGIGNPAKAVQPVSVQKTVSYTGGPLYAGNSRDTEPGPSDTSATLDNPVHNEIIIAVDTDSLISNEPSAPTVKKSEQENNKIFTRKLSGGLTYSFNNVWLLNNETFEGLNSSSLIKTELTYGQELGIFLNLQLNQKSSAQLEYYTFSQTGQRYKEYINALYQTKAIELEYDRVQLLYRHAITGERSLLSVHGVAGLFGARLSSARESIGNSFNEVKYRFSEYDYGVTAGLDTEFRINPRLFAVPGVRARYSVSNMSSASRPGSVLLSPTHSAAIGISFAIKYNF